MSPAEPSLVPQNPRITVPISRFLAGPDGLKLHVADFLPDRETATPVVCLAGLSNNGRDFTRLAQRLASLGHRVIAIDYRGRGLSAWDPDPRNYRLDTERADILAVLDAMEIDRAIFVGTSHGGLHVMGLAAARPSLLEAVVLNDVGPIIETQGLIRMKVSLAHRPPPVNWAEAADTLRRRHSTQFTALEPEDWDLMARATVAEAKGQLFWDHDPGVARSLDHVGPDMTPINLWAQFDAFARIPVLAIRGANSDILSAATFAAMQSRIPTCRGLEIAGQGHAPTLTDENTIAAICKFFASIVAGSKP